MAVELAKSGARGPGRRAADGEPKRRVGGARRPVRGADIKCEGFAYTVFPQLCGPTRQTAGADAARQIELSRTVTIAPPDHRSRLMARRKPANFSVSAGDPGAGPDHRQRAGVHGRCAELGALRSPPDRWARPILRRPRPDGRSPTRTRVGAAAGAEADRRPPEPGLGSVGTAAGHGERPVVTIGCGRTVRALRHDAAEPPAVRGGPPGGPPGGARSTPAPSRREGAAQRLRAYRPAAVFAGIALLQKDESAGVSELDTQFICLSFLTIIQSTGETTGR